MKINKKAIILAIVLSAFLLFTSFSASCSSRAFTNFGWSGSVVDGDTIYVASPGKIAAIQKNNGSVKWQREIVEKDDGAPGALSCGRGAAASVIYANPVVENGVVYVATYSGKIFAYDTASGNLLWKYPTEGYVRGIIGDFIIDNGKIYFAAVGGMVTALNAETQQVVWQYDTKDTLWASPCLDGDTLYVASYDKKLFAINVSSGDPKWSQPFQADGPIVAKPLCNNGVVYIGSLDRGIYAINAENGELIWEFSAESDAEFKPRNWFWATPLLVDGVIYAPNMDGFIYIIDSADGTLLSAVELANAVSSAPVLFEDRIIVATQEGTVYTINTENYTKNRLKELEFTVQSSLYVDEGIVYVHTIKTENLYAINANSGVVVWYYEVS
ncbi:MAG: PQQ-binding-like beta-propeller repeat protein [Dehalococcoidales bacterium]|nr:PQQ-binding-like beta-propeller repeat protein [Dehalococcoidales bacterium]